jgi:hypothetical protein
MWAATHKFRAQSCREGEFESTPTETRDCRGTLVAAGEGREATPRVQFSSESLRQFPGTTAKIWRLCQTLSAVPSESICLARIFRCSKKLYMGIVGIDIKTCTIADSTKCS